MDENRRSRAAAVSQKGVDLPVVVHETGVPSSTAADEMVEELTRDGRRLHLADAF